MNATLKKYSHYGLGLLAGLSVGGAYADLTGDVQLDTIKVMGTTVTATLNPTVTPCPDGMTLLVDTSNTAGESILSTMLVAKSTGRLVKFTYTVDPVLPICTVSGIDVN